MPMVFDRNLSISRLAMRNLPELGETILPKPRASNAGICELISCIDHVPDNYFTFLEEFTHIKTSKLECGTNAICFTDLREVLRHLRRNQSGVTELVPSVPSGRRGA